MVFFISSEVQWSAWPGHRELPELPALFEPPPGVVLPAAPRTPGTLASPAAGTAVQGSHAVRSWRTAVVARYFGEPKQGAAMTSFRAGRFCVGLGFCFSFWHWHWVGRGQFRSSPERLTGVMEWSPGRRAVCCAVWWTGLSFLPRQVEPP